MKSCHFWAHILESGFGIVWGGGLRCGFREERNWFLVMSYEVGDVGGFSYFCWHVFFFDEMDGIAFFMFDSFSSGRI